MGLAGLAAVALLALLYGRRSRRLGQAQGREALLERSLEAARKAGAIDEDVAGLPDADLYDELRQPGRKRMQLGAADRGERAGSDFPPHRRADRGP